MKVGIGIAAKELGVSPLTLRRWEKAGKIKSERTLKGHRRYDLTSLSGYAKKAERSSHTTLIYARVSSHDQKSDLERQKKLLESFCASNGWVYEIVEDLGSGLNYEKKGLKKLIRLISMKQIDRLVITHKDRLLRFGAELIFSLCEQFGVEVVILNKSENASIETELVQDVLEIITVFSARLYGLKSRKNQKLIEALTEAATKV